MSIEVEQKFHLADRAALERRLAALGARPGETVEHVDIYFAHPARDFAHTDEALRLRRIGEHNYMTYKGPKLDATTKSRREIEIPLSPGEQSAAQTAELLTALGFTAVTEVSKRRTHSTVRWLNRDVEVALDQTEELGNFVELEIVASESDMGPARDCIVSLAKELGLSANERQSYLELLLAARARAGEKP